MKPTHVTVYGADHSPWVQAVLLGLHEANISHELIPLPPWPAFRHTGVLMPAAQIDGGPWEVESSYILGRLGYRDVSEEEFALAQRAWGGVTHRADHAPLFWGHFSLIRDTQAGSIHRFANHFLRSFITLYMYLLIRFAVLTRKPTDPENWADQFLPLAQRLDAAPYLDGDSPNTLDFLAFGVMQCHASIYVPPLAALQTDPRLNGVREWISRMHTRYADYGHLYTSVYFEPHGPPPTRSSTGDRMAFWLGSITMVSLLPITLPLIAFLVARNLRRQNAQ